MKEAEPTFDDSVIPAALRVRYSEFTALDEGGFGKVFRAKDGHLDKLVALKLLHRSNPQGVIRFHKEAKILSKLKHPNIVHVYDFASTESGELYLVMEYVAGKSLDAKVDEGGKIETREAVRLAIQMCDAVQYAHAQGIVHRDLKPRNVMLDPDGNVKVLDFGLAKLLDEVDPFGYMTKTGQMIGTPLYMSPEQALGQEVDERTDVYSLGTLFFKMLTGKVPYQSEKILELFQQRSDQPPPSVQPDLNETSLAPELDRIIGKALKHDKQERYNNLKEFKAALEEFLVAHPARMKRTKLEESIQIAAIAAPKKPLKRATIALLVILVLIIVGGGAFLSFRRVRGDATVDSAIDGSKIKYNTSELLKTGERADLVRKDLPPGFHWFYDEDEKKTFCMGEGQIVDDDLKALAKVQGIEHLQLAMCLKITDKGIEHLRGKPFKSINFTDLTTVNEKFLDHVSTMRELDWLRLNFTNVTSKHITHLAPSDKLDFLQLDMCRNFGDDGLRYVVDHFPNMRLLHIDGTAITGKGIKMLPKLKKLEVVWLNQLSIADSDLESLIDVKGLIGLFLSRTKVTDKALDAVAKMKTLQYVDVLKCPNLTREGIARLRKTRPDINVIDRHTEDYTNNEDYNNVFNAPEGLE